MDKETFAFILICLIFVGLGSLLGLTIGMRRGERIKEQEIQQQAVEMGIGGWRIIDNTGKTEFYWKGIEDEQ